MIDNVTAYLTTITEDDFASCIATGSATIMKIHVAFHATPITIDMGPERTQEGTEISQLL